MFTNKVDGINNTTYFGLNSHIADSEVHDKFRLTTNYYNVQPI